MFRGPMMSQRSCYDNDRDVPDGENQHDSLLRPGKYAANKYPNKTPSPNVRGESVNSRYSSDPCKLLYQGKDVG